jgi:hypothetical protein
MELSSKLWLRKTMNTYKVSTATIKDLIREPSTQIATTQPQNYWLLNNLASAQRNGSTMSLQIQTL